MPEYERRFGLLRSPAEIRFGEGVRAGVPATVRSLGRKVMISCDPFLSTTPEFGALRAALTADGAAVTVYTDIVPELPLATIDAAIAAARIADPDVLIGYGGGSALDLAKLVAVGLTHGGPISRYYGEHAVPGPVLPIVAIPTTAGTGSEVTPVAVLADPEREVKVGVSSPYLIPRYAFVDPELTLGAPARVTAASGIDAFVHAVESYTAAERVPDWSARTPVFVGRNDLTSLLGLEAVRLIGAALPRAVADGSDRAARHDMAYGSLLAGMAFGAAGTHLSHALQYPIGAATHTPHGVGVGLMLPYVLQAVLPASADRLADIAGALGVGGTGAALADAQAAVDAVADLVRTIGIPTRLDALGVTDADVPRLATLALQAGRLAGNAAVPPSRELFERLLAAAVGGDRSSLVRVPEQA